MLRRMAMQAREVEMSRAMEGEERQWQTPAREVVCVGWKCWYHQSRPQAQVRTTSVETSGRPDLTPGVQVEGWKSRSQAPFVPSLVDHLVSLPLPSIRLHAH